MNKRKQPPRYDLARLKWLDPCCDTKFTRKEPAIRGNASSEALLQNIVRLTDEIFDHLSVFEQFPEATSRGARADPKKKLVFPNNRGRLMRAEQELWSVYRVLRRKRGPFVERQLESLGIGPGTRSLRVHIGSGGQHLKDWLNIDAGGADLMLNVNWGLQLPSACANFVYCAHLLEHLRYSDQGPVFAREVHRILAKGGTVRFVVPDLRKLLVAYANNDHKYFGARKRFYPLSKGFVTRRVATLDYVLLFCGAGPQVLNYNHKFGYDSATLRKLLVGAGFTRVKESTFQGSAHPELRVDDFSYDAQARHQNWHYSLFMEATK